MSANRIFSYENAMKKQTIINWWLDNIFEPLITLKLLDYGNDVRKWMQKLNGITSLCCLLSDPVSENGNGHNAFHHIDFILNCVIINLQVWLTPCWRDARVRHENTPCHNITWSKKQQEKHTTGLIFVFLLTLFFIRLRTEQSLRWVFVFDI